MQTSYTSFDVKIDPSHAFSLDPLRKVPRIRRPSKMTLLKVFLGFRFFPIIYTRAVYP